MSAEGLSSDFQPEVEAAFAPFIGRPTKVSDLYAAAAQVEAAYARAGQVLTRVTVPPQTLADGGTFRLVVVEGFIERIDGSGLPPAVDAAVQERLQPLVRRPALSLAELERMVLLAGSIPGVTLRSTLLRGIEAGGAQLALGADYDPLALAIGVQNNVGQAYGDWAFSAQMTANNLLGRGEMFYAQAIGGQDMESLFGRDPLRRIIGLGAVLPVNAGGLAFNPEYTRADTTPRTPVGGVPTEGRFERVALRLRYPLLLSRQETLTLGGGLDFVAETTIAKAFDQALSKDRLRYVYAEVDWARDLGGTASLAANGVLTQGIAGLGARGPAAALATGIPLSRQESQPDFTRASARVRLDAGIGAGLAFSAVARGQLTFSGALPASVQFSLDGEDGVSGFTQGDLSVDRGISLRGELARPVPLGTTGQVTPYGFLAYGTGELVRPTVLEARTFTARSAGAGLRLLARLAGLTVINSVEVSRNHSSAQPDDRTRVTASMTIQF